MSSAKQKTAADVASGFSITGLLDASSRTRERFPVEEIPVDAIADHPDNTAYSMDAESIRSLASSILRNGLTDLPLVRKMDDGSWQMISGHRRRAAYALLAQDDPAFAKLPCRVISNITDSQALALLHSANYFVRQLTVTERAAATRALGIEAKHILKTDPAFKGSSADEVKAAIITSQTGKPVSAKTIRRGERIARIIQKDLIPQWVEDADTGKLSEESVVALSRMEPSRQEEIWQKREGRELSKTELSKLVRQAASGAPEPDKRLVRALTALRAYGNSATEIPPQDTEAVSEISRLSARISQLPRHQNPSC